MRFGSILLLLLAIAGIVIAFNYCGPGKQATREAAKNSQTAMAQTVEGAKKATQDAVNATKDAAQTTMQKTSEATAKMVKAGKKPLRSVAELADRVEGFASAKQEGDTVYVHAHEVDASMGTLPAEHVLKNVATQLPGILATSSLNGVKTMMVYQSIPAIRLTCRLCVGITL